MDEEHFRLSTGFNDIIVVIASLLLLSAFWHAARIQVLRRAPQAVQSWPVPPR